MDETIDRIIQLWSSQLLVDYTTEDADALLDIYDIPLTISVETTDKPLVTKITMVLDSTYDIEFMYSKFYQLISFVDKDATADEDIDFINKFINVFAKTYNQNIATMALNVLTLNDYVLHGSLTDCYSNTVSLSIAFNNYPEKLLAMSPNKKLS